MLTSVQKSEYGTPVFIIPKKEGIVIFITDYHNLNHKLLRNNYLLPIIGDTMYQLEGFQYSMEIDLNMGYYTIHIFPGSRELMTIVTEFGKFIYNSILMVL